MKCISGEVSQTRRGQPAITGHQMSENRGSSVVIDLINHRNLFKPGIQSINQPTNSTFIHSFIIITISSLNPVYPTPNSLNSYATLVQFPFPSPTLLLSLCLGPPTLIGFSFFLLPIFFFLPSPKAESGEAFCLPLNSTILSSTPLSILISYTSHVVFCRRVVTANLSRLNAYVIDCIALLTSMRVTRQPQCFDTTLKRHSLSRGS